MLYCVTALLVEAVQLRVTAPSSALALSPVGGGKTGSVPLPLSGGGQAVSTSISPATRNANLRRPFMVASFRTSRSYASSLLPRGDELPARAGPLISTARLLAL